jgi:hypothetical protein
MPLRKQGDRPRIQYTPLPKRNLPKYPCSYSCPNCGWPIANPHTQLCRECACVARRPPIDPRTYVIEGKPCRKLPLTQGFYTLIDAAQYDYLRQWHWQACKGTAKYNFKYYVSTRLKWKGKFVWVSLPQLLLGAKPDIEYDHRNHDTLDNRRSNLRRCSQPQNSQNHPKRKDNTSGYIGVRLICKGSRKWLAQVNANGKCAFYQTFDSKEEAARARDAAAIQLHGEFAVLNFPTS